MKCDCCGQELAGKSLITNVIGWTGRKIAGTHTCQHCGAISGSVYLGEFREIIKNRFAQEDAPSEYWRFYDFEVLGSSGIARYHGWYDVRTREILQTG